MKEIFKVVSYGEHIHFLSIKNESNINFDADIAKFLKISLDVYKNTLITQYHGITQNTEIYFDTLENANAALEWVNSIFIANKLSN